MKSQISSRLCAVVVILLAALPWTVYGAPPVQVNAAEPSSAPQGMISLDVAVSGSGFDSSATVSFFVTGTTNPGGITVKKVIVNGSKKLTATIDVADAAIIDKFDIEVRLSGGRKGKGTSLFAVFAKAGNDPCLAAVDFPSFVYSQPNGQEGTYVSDRTGQCKRLLIGGPTTIYKAFSYPVRDDLGNPTNRGRVVWFGRDPADTSSGVKLQYNAMDFEVSGTTITPGPVRLIADLGQLDPPGGGGNNGVCCGLDLTVDGRVLYAPTKAELRPEGYVNKVVKFSLPADLSDLDPQDPPAQTTVFEHKPSPRNDIEYATEIDVNAANDLIYIKQLTRQDGQTSYRVLRVDLDADLTDTGSNLETAVVASAPIGDTAFVGADTSSPASDLIAVVFSETLGGCKRINIINGRTGTILNEGSDWPAFWLTWAHGKVLTAGFRRGCRRTDYIVAVDPLTGVTTTLLPGLYPEGR